MSSIRRRTGWTMVGMSLALHVVTVICYSRQPDHFAAFTVLPIWMWGGLGLLLSTVAFYFLRAPLSLILSGIWAVTLLIGADEARVLANVGKPAPLPGRPEAHQGQAVMRVITLNCATFAFGNPAKDLATWHPDIVLLQQVYPQHVRQIADVLYSGRGDYRTHRTNGVVTRWKIQREFRPPGERSHLVTLELPDGSLMEVANIHLSTAATDLRLWNPNAWRTHYHKRIERRHELGFMLDMIAQQTSFPETPTLLGGDFNAPANDPVHLLLERDFVDAFVATGTGWGNTFQRRVPVIRIDHLYATRHLVPIRSKVVTSLNSDHRMVIADFLMR
jgi:endonuclease/exonuclease/phosphatase (EEP) superfamily protein YafD